MNPDPRMTLWNGWKMPPSDALKKIEGGRLKGKHDISPVWRMQALTEALGPCGIGWKYEIVNLWTVPGTEGQVCAFAQVNLYISVPSGDTSFWSQPIPGIGGSMLIEMEKSGLHTSDEAYKMAVTDALSVAMKALGVAADVYRGLADSKYSRPQVVPPRQQAQEGPAQPRSAPQPVESASDALVREQMQGSLAIKAERQKANLLFWMEMKKHFGEAEPWLSSKDDKPAADIANAGYKRVAIKGTFGTGDLKAIKQMPDAEFLQLFRDNFENALDEALKAKKEAENAEPPF